MEATVKYQAGLGLVINFYPKTNKEKKELQRIMAGVNWPHYLEQLRASRKDEKPKIEVLTCYAWRLSSRIMDRENNDNHPGTVEPGAVTRLVLVEANQAQIMGPIGIV